MWKEFLPEIRQILIISAGFFCVLGAFLLSYKGKSKFISALLVFSGIALFASTANMRKLVFDVNNFAKIEMEKAAEEIKQDLAIEVAEISHGLKIIQEFTNNQKIVNAKQNENNIAFDLFRGNQEAFNEILVSQIKKYKIENNTLLENLRKNQEPEIEISNISDTDKFQKFQSLVDENGKYNVLIFFRGRRLKDADQMNQLLLSNGYKSASIQTSLKEVLVGEEPEPDTTAIISLDGLSSVSERISELLGKHRELTRGSISDWGNYPLKKGHIQLYLF